MTHNLSSKLENQINGAVKIVKAGGIIAFPTDTIYGLGANVYDDKAINRIYEVKQRPRHMPLPILLSDESQISIVAASVSQIAQLLIKSFWPGGLTLVLSRAASFKGSVLLGGNTVAVRIPNHIVPVTIIREAGVPLVGTSANISNKPGALTAEEVEVQLGNDVDIIVDGGKCPGGLESTVIDLTGETPEILRRGAVSEEQIARVCKNI